MLINSFKLISFDSKIWNSRDIAAHLMNVDTKDKALKTREIMEFIASKISSGEAKIDKTPNLYALNIKNHSKNITSIIGAINYNEKKVLFPNEDTHPEKIKTYKEIFNNYKMQINPVLTFYKNGPSITSLLKNVMNTPPKIEASIKDSEYKLWSIGNPADLANIRNNISQIDRLYIADGHHRFSIFQSLSRKIAAQIMISLTDAESICMKSCHRVIIGQVDNNWRLKINQYCVLERVFTHSHSKDIVLCFRNGETYRVLFREEILEKFAVYFAVDNIIFKKSFGLDHSENRIFPLPGTISLQDAEKIFSLYDGSSAIVFIPELDISEFFKVVDNGDKLPPTSTWFEPKIIDGFLMSKFG